MSKFNELLAELEAAAAEQDTLAKALPQDDGADDKTIQAAAAEGDESEEDESEEPESTEGEESAEDDDDAGKMTKSMVLDGEEYEVVDVEQLTKSLAEHDSRLQLHDETLTKALQTTLGALKSQSELIKSLSHRVETLSSQGRGRKTMVSIAEKPTTLAKSDPEQDSPGQIMAKAQSAHAAGRITGLDVARCEAALNSGVAAPADVLSKIN